jgi:DNA invertase Pin-like site-specific DNA recombinase
MARVHPGWLTRKPDFRPVAYGYLRAEHPDPEALAEARKAIAAFCVSAGLRLITVFCDQGEDGTADGADVLRPGWTGLLDALGLPEATTLVVLDLDHLSPHEVIREGLLRQVRRTGAELRVMGDESTEPTAETRARTADGNPKPADARPRLRDDPDGRSRP